MPPLGASSVGGPSKSGVGMVGKDTGAGAGVAALAAPVLEDEEAEEEEEDVGVPGMVTPAARPSWTMACTSADAAWSLIASAFVCATNPLT